MRLTRSVLSARDEVGVRNRAATGPCDQADPRHLGRGRMGTRPSGAGARRRRAARRLPQTVQTVNVQHRLEELGLTLPKVAAPLASYVPAVRTGDLVWTSGQLPFVEGALP